MRCQDLMTSVVVSCQEDDTAYYCAQQMRENNIGFVPIVDGRGRLIGVVTDRDLALRVLAEGKPPTTELVDVMTRDVVTCMTTDELEEAEQRMVDRRVSRIVVLGPYSRCLGVLSLSDVARVEESSRAARLLRSVASRESKQPPSLR